MIFVLSQFLKLKVAYTTESAIQSRLKTAGYDYAVEVGKNIHATVYTNKVTYYRTFLDNINSFKVIQDDTAQNYRHTFFTQALPCQISFFPDEDCKTGNTQIEMFEVFDALSKDEEVHFARPCIHYFRGSYCSGGHRDWPFC